MTDDQFNIEFILDLSYDQEIFKVRKAILKRRRRYFRVIKESIRDKMKKKGEWACHCGSCDGLEMHHILPLSYNGRNHYENINALCHDHHKAAHVQLGVVLE